jgi:hypothetical protein
VLLKNLELPDKSWLGVPSIKQPESARSRRMSRLRVGERHRNLLLGARRTGDGLSRRRYGVGDLLLVFLLVNQEFNFI